MNRRQLLAVMGAVVTARLSGCASDGGDGNSGTPEPLDGQWVLRAHVTNEDSVPRDWRVACQSTDRTNVGAASGTLPAEAETELELSGRRYDEQREVVVEADRGTIAEAWRPGECRRLVAEVRIADGRPHLSTACDET